LSWVGKGNGDSKVNEKKESRKKEGGRKIGDFWRARRRDKRNPIKTSQIGGKSRKL